MQVIRTLNWLAPEQPTVSLSVGKTHVTVRISGGKPHEEVMRKLREHQKTKTFGLKIGRSGASVKLKIDKTRKLTASLRALAVALHQQPTERTLVKPVILTYK
jgi:hypothetical protein